MHITQNECVGCTDIGLHCIGPSCPNLNVTRFYCDRCGDEIPYKNIYDVEGQEICLDCLKSIFKR